MDGRTFSSAKYRYGFNGKENDNEVKGTGNQQDYGMRIYDPRLGRFLSVDPMFKSFPTLTSYQFASNKPINCVDIDGLESADAYMYLDYEGKYTGVTIIVKRDKDGPLGDGLLVHQLVMTSNNPGGMSQNFTDVEDFSKASYVHAVQAEGTSTQTDKNVAKIKKMEEKQMEVAFPIIKQLKDIKSGLKKLDNAMEGSSDGANMGTTSKSEWEGAAGGLQAGGKAVKGAGLVVTLFPGGQLFGPEIYGAGSILEGIGDVTEISVALAYGEKNKALLKTMNMVLGAGASKLIKVENDDAFEQMMGETFLNESMDVITDSMSETMDKTKTSDQK